MKFPHNIEMHGVPPSFSLGNVCYSFGDSRGRFKPSGFATTTIWLKRDGFWFRRTKIRSCHRKWGFDFSTGTGRGWRIHGLVDQVFCLGGCYDWGKQRTFTIDSHPWLFMHCCYLGNGKICPKVDPWKLYQESLPEVMDTSLTPAAIKKLSRSVMDLSSMSEVKGISKSTSNLMTGGMFLKKSKPKSESKTNLIKHSATSSVESLQLDYLYENLDEDELQEKQEKVAQSFSTNGLGNVSNFTKKWKRGTVEDHHK